MRIALLACLLASPLFSADDAAWLQTKGTLIFHDAFEREETGTGLKDIGNGWESATADRVPQIKQADLDGGVMKIASATKEAGHAAHIHHDAGFADGGVVHRDQSIVQALRETYCGTIGAESARRAHVRDARAFNHRFRVAQALTDAPASVEVHDALLELLGRRRSAVGKAVVPQRTRDARVAHHSAQVLGSHARVTS